MSSSPCPYTQMLLISSHLNVSKCSWWGGRWFALLIQYRMVDDAASLWYWKHLRLGLSAWQLNEISPLFFLFSLLLALLPSVCKMILLCCCSLTFFKNISAQLYAASNTQTHRDTSKLHLHHIWLWQGHVKFTLIRRSRRAAERKKLNMLSQAFVRALQAGYKVMFP